MDDSYRLNTPEQVDLAYEVAGLGTRMIAAIVDSLVQFAVIFALVVSGLVIGAMIGGPVVRRLGGSDSPLVVFSLIAVAVLVLFLISNGYFIFFEMVWNGQSPGKRTAGIRVIGVSGTPVTLGQSLIRNLLRVVDVLPTSYMIGIIVMLLNARSQRFGDLAAGTIVVKIRQEASPRLLQVPRGDSELAPQLAVAFDAEDVALARDFLLRRDELPSARRAALAERIAGRLRSRLGPDTGREPAEELIARVVAVRR